MTSNGHEQMTHRSQGISRTLTTTLVAVAMSTAPAPSGAQPALSPADSALVRAILIAEDQRDQAAEALAAGVQHSDPRIRIIARRARYRITDPLFAARDSLPQAPAPRAWPEPEWRIRYRALADRRNDCATMRSALTDPTWPVRLRAADLLTNACSSDQAILATLRGWMNSLPPDPGRRNSGEVSWHAAAHALVAISRVKPDEARVRLGSFARHRTWHLRQYSARAAAQLADTATLRSLARDADPNVREVAIEVLSALTGHADDDLYIAALASSDVQPVRAAARALAGSPRPDARAVAAAAFQRWAARGNMSERDVRVALLVAAERDSSADRPPPHRVDLPATVVALALGADVRLRVTMAPASGGGSFDVRLRGDVAPVTAARILELVDARYYDGLTWHRVEHDFVIQGGSPGANEYVGFGQYFRDEVGSVPHVRGTVGMSTRGHDTGDAQWFVNLKDNLRLGRDYTVFGEVIAGIDVVDGILEGDVIESIRRVSR